jgi:TetR/AcrR family transcriptional repressor of nem operon
VVTRIGNANLFFAPLRLGAFALKSSNLSATTPNHRRFKLTGQLTRGIVSALEAKNQGANMKKPCETKEKLLHVGFDLIWDGSYGSVSVDDICRRADINKGSFYYFFPSKADLVVEAYEEHWKEKRLAMDRIFSRQVPPLERMRQWCQFIYEGQKQKAQKYGHVCGCPFASVGSETATFDEKIRSKSEQLMNSSRKYVESAIADAIQEGSLPVKDPVATSIRLQSLLVGMLLEARVQNDLKVLDNLESTVLDFIGAKSAGVATT